MTGIKRLLLRVLLFPVFMGLSVDAAPVRPEDIPEDSWNTMTDGEKAAMSITDEMVAEQEGEVSAEELDGVLAEEPAEEPGAVAEAAKETPAAAAVAEVEIAAAPVIPAGLPTDEDLLAFRPTVSATELKIGKVEVPQEFTDRLDALDLKEDGIEKRFEESEIDREEYRKQLRQVSRDRDAVKQEQSDTLFDLKQQARDSARSSAEMDLTGDAFLKARPYYQEKGTDGETTMKAEALFGALEKAVAKVSRANPGLPFMQRLIMADRAVKEAFGMKDAAPVKPAEKGKDKGKEIPAAPLPKEVTLAELPRAGEHDTDPFAYLDRITDPVKREAAIAKLNPDQMEAYERGGR